MHVAPNDRPRSFRSAKPNFDPEPSRFADQVDLTLESTRNLAERFPKPLDRLQKNCPEDAKDRSRNGHVVSPLRQSSQRPDHPRIGHDLSISHASTEKLEGPSRLR